MTQRALLVSAIFGSAALLLGALAFQHWGGLAPCKLCIWQRWPHLAAILIGLLALMLPMRALLGLGAVAAMTTAGIGLYHVGVEQGWWQGPTTCSSGAVGGQSVDALMDQIMAAPLVQCDQIAWSFLGLSMAGWNAAFSLGCAALWLIALRRAG